MENKQESLFDLSKLNADEILKKLNSSFQGLQEEEAKYRLKKDGLNQISDTKKINCFSRLIDSLKNPLIVLLIVLVIVSYSIKEHETAIIIAIMVVISTVISFIQESSADKAAEKLQEMVSLTTTVLRQTEKNILIKNIVVGDVIKLSAGHIIPADLRILSSNNLYINQSALTGESLPVEKSENALKKETKNIFDLNNICFMGSYVSSGTALGIVTSTGDNTYFGKLAKKLSEKKEKTAFDEGLNKFTWLMIKFMLVSAPLVFVINAITKGDWVHAFLFALAVTVALTPEMLPMIVTVNLAKGALVLSKQKVIVKKLNAIQNLGAINILCSDKTGTLTQNKVILEKHIDVAGKENEHVLHYAYLNSYFQTGLRNLLDEAIFEHINIETSEKVKENFKKIEEIPFDFERRKLSVILERQDEKHFLFCKGAVEEVLDVCSKFEIVGSKQIFNIDKEKLENLITLTNCLNNDGFRLLAVAYKELPDNLEKYDTNTEQNLTLVGFVAFLDPPKETVSEAITELNRYGVEIKILTGDNDIIANKICKDVGLNVKGIMIGEEIENLSEEELIKSVQNKTIFAKLSPFQKEKIINSLRQSGVVGFLGDGINDAPALKAADVGISVNTAVDIAKETADIILLEKNLLVLAQGVREGRKVFSNAVKYIKSRAALNFGNMLSIVVGSIFLPFLPMLPIQIISCNLLTDFANIAIPTDNVDKKDLISPKPWNIKSIEKSMIVLGLCVSLFDFILFGVMIFVFKAWNNESLFQTGWFVEFITIQITTLYAIRTSKISFINSFPSYQLVISHIMILLVTFLLPFLSFSAQALNLIALPHLYWVMLMLIVIGYVSIANTVKRKIQLS